MLPGRSHCLSSSLARLLRLLCCAFVLPALGGENTAPAPATPGASEAEDAAAILREKAAPPGTSPAPVTPATAPAPARDATSVPAPEKNTRETSAPEAPVTPLVPTVPLTPASPVVPAASGTSISVPVNTAQDSPASPVAPETGMLSAGGERLVRDEVHEAAAADTPDEVEASLDVMERLFKGGNYAQTIGLAEALLANPHFSPIPPAARENLDYSQLSAEVVAGLDAQYTFLNTARAARQMKREMVRLFHARALYEKAVIAADRAGVRAAIAEFVKLADNVYLFTAPQYQAEAGYWAGRGFFYLADYSSAVKALRKVAGYNPSPDIDIQSCLLLADALKALADQVGSRGDDRPGRSPQDMPADPQEVLKTRAGLLRDAERELSKITTNHPQSRHNPETELRLIELRFELQEYEDAERLAAEFLRRATPGSENYAKAAYYQANSVYQQGRIAAAAELFRVALDENKNASPAIRADLFYGYGWTNSRLADTSGPDFRLVNLTRSQAALRQAVRLLPFGARRQNAIMDLAQVLIDMQLYRDALGFLQEVVGEQKLGMKANFLAGGAARGLGQYDLAERHFQAGLEMAAREGDVRQELEALLSLAQMEDSRGNPAEALEYYRQAQAAATRQRQFDLVAAASLGMAQSAAELGSFDAAGCDRATRRLAEAILAAAGATDGKGLRPAARMVALRAAALREWSRAGDGNLRMADEILERLRGRLLPRLREDELEYVQGRVLYLRARNQLKNLPLAYNVQIDQYDPVFATFREAEVVLNTALQANPRGLVSPRVRYLLGEVYDAAADLKIELAAFLRARGMGTEAVSLEEEGVKFYQKAVGPLSLAVLDSESDAGLRIDARALLGKTYLALGQRGDDPVQYEKGLDEFRILVAETSIPRAKRLDAVRNMSTALARKKRKEEAVALLMPYASEDIASALLAAQILQELRQLRQAYELLVTAIASAQKDSSADSDQLAEAIFTAHKAGLSQAAEVARSTQEVAAQQTVSGEALLALSERYPGTVWASRALLELGKWLLGQGRWQETIRKSDEGLARLRDDLRAVDTVQALYLLRGQALLAGGKAQKDAALFKQARDAFAQAERANTRTDLGRTQRAMSIRMQGDACLALGERDAALRYYGRVFSLFHNEYEQADLARVAAAELHASAGNYELALKILDAGFNQDLLLPYKMRYRKKLGMTGE